MPNHNAAQHCWTSQHDEHRFFAREDHAGQLTRRLLVLFALSVAAIIVAIYLVAVLYGLCVRTPFPHPPFVRSQLID